MPADRLLSQDEIDSVFKSVQGPVSAEMQAKRALPYDFRRPDRIAKDQFRAIHVLHENFARSLASSLSAFLRAYVMVNLVSVEQVTFLEFSQCLPSPSCIASLGMHPYDGRAILEINPMIVYPVLEMLLGGTGKTVYKAEREITEIEQSIMEGLYRIILHDLKEAWSMVATIKFAIEAHETEPQLLQVLAPNEAVVAIGVEIRLGEISGMMNLGIPSIVIKMLRAKFDQHWAVRRSESSEEFRGRLLDMLKPSELNLDARLQGPHLSVEDMLRLDVGDVLELDYPLNRQVNMLVNGGLKMKGHVVTSGHRRAFHVSHWYVGD